MFPNTKCIKFDNQMDHSPRIVTPDFSDFMIFSTAFSVLLMYLLVSPFTPSKQQHIYYTHYHVKVLVYPTQLLKYSMKHFKFTSAICKQVSTLVY